jgi:hypothetical protein
VKNPEDLQEVLPTVDSMNFHLFPFRVPGSEVAVLPVRYNKMVLPWPVAVGMKVA